MLVFKVKTSGKWYLNGRNYQRNCFSTSFQFLLNALKKNKCEKQGKRENYNKNHEKVIKAVPENQQQGMSENNYRSEILSFLFGTPALHFLAM